MVTAYPRLPLKIGPGLAGAAGLTLLLVLVVPSAAKPVVLVSGICVVGLLVTAWLADGVLSKDDGTSAMRAVSDPIKVCPSRVDLPASYLFCLLRRYVGGLVRNGSLSGIAL